MATGLIKNNVGRCRHVPSPKYADQERKYAVCTVAFYSILVASLSFCLYVTCHSVPVLNHRPLLPCFVDCHFTWKIKLKTNNACHFYIMTNVFGLGLPDNLSQSIPISVVSTVKRIISRKQNFSSFTGRNSTHSLIYLWLQESNKTGEGLFFHGEGDVWLLLNTFHVFLIVKIQYSLKDQSTTGQILLSDVCVWLILFWAHLKFEAQPFALGTL